MSRRVSGVRAEKVDTRAVLIDGDLGHANGTSGAVRREERDKVLRYWPEGLRARMAAEGAPWGLLVEPTGFGDVDPEAVHAFVSGYRAGRGRWPSVGLVRRRFGRTTNHRLAGEVSGQGSLL